MNKVPDNGLCRKGYGSGKDIPTNGIGKGRISVLLHVFTRINSGLKKDI